MCKMDDPKLKIMSMLFGFFGMGGGVELNNPNEDSLLSLFTHSSSSMF